MKIAFSHSESVANNIKTFWFRASPKLDYIAGQYIELTIPHNNTDSRGTKRWFTLSSSPTEDLISITTKQTKSNMSSFKKALLNMKPGDTANINLPMGDFVLPMDKSISLLFIAGGVGITPVRSIIKWLIDKDEKRNIKIVYGVKKLDETAFTDLFYAYEADLNVILSEPHAGWKGKVGRLDARSIIRDTGVKDSLIYVSGPEQMVERLEADFLKQNIAPNKLVLDFYHGYTNML